MKKSKNQGITLVALIITIIVMLILVGVTVQILINSGLIGIAQNAGDRTESAYEEESNLSKVTIGGKEYNSIEEYLNGKNKIDPVKVLQDSTEDNIAVDENGNIIDLTDWTTEIIGENEFKIAGGAYEPGYKGVDENVVMPAYMKQDGKIYVLTSIGSNAFTGVTSMKSVVIPASVGTIEASAFSGCTSLQTVYYSGTPAQWASITIGTNNDPLTNANIIAEDTLNARITLTMVNTANAVTADGTKVSAIKEGAPIPVDFYYVGGTKNTGIVISDNSTDENKGADAELQGNQFVWVPVLQNQKLKLEVNSEEDITGITIKDPLKAQITTDKNGQALSPGGKAYTVEVNPTINGIYTVTVNAGNKTKTETIDVTTLYAQDFFAGSTSYTDSTIATHAESVNTYGGFYIARYEAGTDTARTSSSDTTATVYSKKNMYPYNWISQTDAITKSSGMYNKTNITSALTNAAAWDRTINWLTETNAITTNEVVDSTSFGNYRNSTFDFTGKYIYDSTWTEATTSTPKPENTEYLLGTGVSRYTKRNNIYDLAGNCREWTTSGGGIGGSYVNSGIYDSVTSSRGDFTWSKAKSLSFRPSLYINSN